MPLFSKPQWDRRLQLWSVFNIFDGSISNPDAPHLSKFREEYGYEGLEAAAKLGLAAGRIYLPISGCAEEPDLVMSGFWVHKTYFLTAAHFFRNGLPEDVLVPYLKNKDEVHKAVVSSQLEAHGIPRPGLVATEEVILIELDRDNDVALFRAVNEPRKNNIKNAIELSALSTLDPMSSTLPIWTAGYNCGDQQCVHALGADQLQLAKKDLQLTADSDSHPYWIHKAREVIKLSPGKKNADAEEAASKQRVPNQADIFCPAKRAFAVGQILSEELGKAIPAPQRDQGRRTILTKHTCPGNFGISGAMIGLFERTDTKSPKIIGLFQGSGDRFSLFSRFTDDGIRWICELIEREENKNRGPEDDEGKKESDNVSD